MLTNLNVLAVYFLPYPKIAILHVPRDVEYKSLENKSCVLSKIKIN